MAEDILGALGYPQADPRQYTFTPTVGDFSGPIVNPYLVPRNFSWLHALAQYDQLQQQKQQQEEQALRKQQQPSKIPTLQDLLDVLSSRLG